MIDKLYFYISSGTVPYRNIAVEAFMLERLPERSCIFYLWQNRRTVVVGRNQNAWKECRVGKLEADGGFLARRLSGGGAVFHDLGNLCFTFIVPAEDYDTVRQTGILLDALERLGLNAVMKGRNDLEIGGKKFSGHAYHRGTINAMHHGTFLVHADLSLARKYLSPPPEKITAKGIASIQSRIANLAEFDRLLTIEKLRAALIESVERAYGCAGVFLPDAFFDEAKITELEAGFAAPEWRYGRSPECSVEIASRFDWGGVELHFDVVKGKIGNTAIFSDCMDEEFILGLPRNLDGTEFRSAAGLREKVDGLYQLFQKRLR
jgi:lipoate-protein ligase A